MQRLDQINAFKPANLFDSKSLALRIRKKQIGRFKTVYRGKGNAGDYGLLLSAMVVQKSEDVIRPDGGSKIAKGMAV